MLSDGVRWRCAVVAEDGSYALRPAALASAEDAAAWSVITAVEMLGQGEGELLIVTPCLSLTDHDVRSYAANKKVRLAESKAKERGFESLTLRHWAGANPAVALAANWQLAWTVNGAGKLEPVSPALLTELLGEGQSAA
jgi:hypothetical protein